MSDCIHGHTLPSGERGGGGGGEGGGGVVFCF